MTTPIRRRFRVDTLLLDRTAPVAVLDVPALLTTNDLFTGDRWTSLAEDEWSDLVDVDTYPVEYYWLQAVFGQEKTPDRAVIIWWDDTDPYESVEEALDAAVSDGAAWYTLSYIGDTSSDISTQLDIAQYVESFEEKTQCVLQSRDPNAIVGNATTDIGYQVRALSLTRTSVIYHPTGTVGGVDVSDQRPDGALVGRNLPSDEGAEQWDYKPLTLVSDSWLTSAQQNTLRTKGYNFVETFKNTTFTHVFPGRTCTDREIRLQWGADWFDANVQASLANFAFRTPLMAFDYDTFAAVESLIRNWCERAVGRRIIKAGYVVALPDPDTIPAATRASGQATFENVYDCELNSAVDGWRIGGNWVIGGV